MDALRAGGAVVALVAAHEVLLAVGIGGADVLHRPGWGRTLADLDVTTDAAHLHGCPGLRLPEAELVRSALVVGGTLDRALAARAATSVVAAPITSAVWRAALPGQGDADLAIGTFHHRVGAKLALARCGEPAHKFPVAEVEVLQRCAVRVLQTIANQLALPLDALHLPTVAFPAATPAPVVAAFLAGAIRRAAVPPSEFIYSLVVDADLSLRTGPAIANRGIHGNCRIHLTAFCSELFAVNRAVYFVAKAVPSVERATHGDAFVVRRALSARAAATVVAALLLEIVDNALRCTAICVAIVVRLANIVRRALAATPTAAVVAAFLSFTIRGTAMPLAPIGVFEHADLTFRTVSAEAPAFRLNI